LRDEGLVGRILRGDKAAGERLVSEHYPRVYRWLRHLTGSVDTAEELTQQTFIKAWQCLGGLRAEGSLSVWLHRIAYHQYTHWLRDRKVDCPLEETSAVSPDRTMSALDAILLERALAQLSEDHRQTFLLYHVQELSVPEVAGVLGVPDGTVKSRLFVARQRLRELLMDDGLKETDETRENVPSSCGAEGGFR
jgi:RNA polymerase sigma-70 factor, ECF subfamily